LPENRPRETRYHPDLHRGEHHRPPGGRRLAMNPAGRDNGAGAFLPPNYPPKGAGMPPLLSYPRKRTNIELPTPNFQRRTKDRAAANQTVQSSTFSVQSWTFVFQSPSTTPCPMPQAPCSMHHAPCFPPPFLTFQPSHLHTFTPSHFHTSILRAGHTLRRTNNRTTPATYIQRLPIDFEVQPDFLSSSHCAFQCAREILPRRSGRKSGWCHQ